jgi:glucokinase
MTNNCKVFMNEAVAGIDIGGTNTSFGLVSREGKVLSKGTLGTRQFAEAEELVQAVSADLKQQVQSLQKQFPGIRLLGAGVGAPNANPYTGMVEYAPNLSWKGVVPLEKLFSEALDTHAKITNDAKAAALGEQMFGAARGSRNFLVITLGTGLGSGIVANGEMIYGHDGFAGELGHVTIERGGRLCGCGRYGCLETYCSATGIVRTYRELKPNVDDSVDSKEITRRALEGEAEAQEAYRFTGEMLGYALSNFAAITSPEMIILFGGLVKAGDLLLNPVREAFEANLLNIYRGKIKIKISELHESDAALLGSASLIYREAFKE